MAIQQNDDVSRKCKKDGIKVGRDSAIACYQLEVYWNRF